MNEPHGTNGTWPGMAQAGTDGVRSADSDHWIIVAGDSWSSARNWYDANPDLNVQDAFDKIIYEAHCYFDSSSSGQYANSYDADNIYPNIGVVEVSPFIQWLRENDARGFVGEYGVPDDDPRWNEVLERFMQHLGANGVSGTYWAGGSYWGDYKLSVHPTSNLTVDRPQMSVLQQDFTAGGLSTPAPAVEVILDSETPAGVTITGNWSTSTAAPGYLGQNYLHDGNSEIGKSVKLSPELATAGTYEVYLRWTASGNRASNAPIDIIHSSGTDLVQVDQKSNGGTWVSLGIYDFNAGSSGSVIIRNEGANGYVIADAVRFSPR